MAWQSLQRVLTSRKSLWVFVILHESQQTEIIHWLIEVNSTRLNYKAFVKHCLSHNFI